MKLTDYKVLSFDCYGTLIDWETGMFEAYQPLLAKSSQSFTRDEVLQTHARLEAQQEAKTPSLIYSKLLALVYARIAKEWGVQITPDECEQFGHAIQNWPAFVDSAAALQYLKKYYKLVILSNIDNESFKASNARLQVEFDYIFTAEDIGTYKPNLNNFNYMLSELAKEGIHKVDILHTAESLFHDHLPANQLGLASAWIHRRHALQGFGATHAPATMPHYDFKFNSLTDMAKAHQDALRNS